jgi:hypothetical protein
MFFMGYRCVRINLLFFLVLTVIGCGGGGSSSDSPADTSQIDGKAVKGALINANVQIFAVEDGNLAAEPLAEGTTDQTGAFSLSLPEPFSGPAKIVVRADGSSSTMRCDSFGGCDADGDGGPEVDYGDEFFLSDSYQLVLYTVIAPGAGAVKRYPTALSDLAARLAEENPFGLNPASIEGANSQVANLFGLTGDLTATPVADASDPDALGGLESADSVKLSLLSAGVLNAANDVYARLSAEEALRAFADQFVSDEGQLYQNYGGFDDRVSLADILVGAIGAGNLVPGSVELGSTGEQIDNELMLASDPSREGEFTKAEPSPGAGSEALAQAKQLVQDVRDLINATNLGPLETAARGFGDEIDAAATLVNEDANAVYSSLSQAAGAIFEAASAVALGDYASGNPDYLASNGVSVGVVPSSSPEDTGGLFTVDADIEGVLVQIEATVEGRYELTGGPTAPILDRNDTYRFENFVIAIEGRAESVGLIAQIEENSRAAAAITASLREASSPVRIEEEYEIDVTGLSLQLSTQVIQKSTLTVENPITFDGDLQVSVGELAYARTYDDCIFCDLGDSTTGAFIFEREEVLVDEAMLSIGGSISNTQGERIQVAITASVAFNGIGLSRETFQDFNNFCFFCVTEDFDLVGVSGSEEGYIGGSLAIDVQAELEGISDETHVAFSASKTGRESGTASLSVRWNGRSLTLSAVGEDLRSLNALSSGPLVITNQDGLELTIDTNQDLFEVGTLVKGDELLGQVERIDDDFALVRFVDGTFESIF